MRHELLIGKNKQSRLQAQSFCSLYKPLHFYEAPHKMFLSSGRFTVLTRHQYTVGPLRMRPANTV